MELRSYGAILWRRIWILALIVGVVILYSGYQLYTLAKQPGALQSYQSNMIMQIGLQPNSHSSDQSYGDYMLISQTLAEELVNGSLLTSQEFSTQVSQQMQADMGSIMQRYGSHANLGPWQDTHAISGALTATHVDALVTVNTTWSTPAGAWALNRAVGEVSTTQMSTYLDYEVRNVPLSPTQAHPLATARVISAASDPSKVAGPSIKNAALLLVLLLVALIVGIALAFLVEYLDDSIYTRQAAVQALHLPVYGEVSRAPSVGRSKANRTSVT